MARNLRSSERLHYLFKLPGRAVAFMLGLQFGVAWPVCAALQSGTYQVLPGATAVEIGDRVTNGSRVVPLSATLKLNLDGPPSLTAFTPNAVLEGGNEFPLTVHSSYGALFTNETYRFHGDYLKEFYPSGTQYLFDWYLSPSTNGQVVWNGGVYWAGGHIWQVTFTNITLVPVPWLTILQPSVASVRITWMTNFTDYILECATNLTAVDWNSVTNAPTTNGNRISVNLETGGLSRFYRLRRP